MPNIHTGDRRSDYDRRNFSYSAHAPERRMSQDRRSGIERRKHKRLQVKDLAFAKLWSENEKDYVQEIGQLLDISKGGLSIRSSLEQEKSSEQSVLGIFLSGSDFHIENLPFKIVADSEIILDSTLSKRALRRYGIQFDNLTSEQESNLNYFLANHTLGEA